MNKCFIFIKTIFLTLIISNSFFTTTLLPMEIDEEQIEYRSDVPQLESDLRKLSSNFSDENKVIWNEFSADFLEAAKGLNGTYKAVCAIFVNNVFCDACEKGNLSFVKELLAE